MCLAQTMSHYQREEWKCLVCGSPGHFARDCPPHNVFKQWHWEQLNAKGVGENNQSEFGRRVPLVIGNCMIGQIINIIWESEIDHLSMPWATVKMMQLLSCQRSSAVLTLESAGEAQSEGASREPQEVDVDQLVMVRESVCLGPFQTEILKGWVKLLLGDMAHIMITPLRAGEGHLWEA